MNKISKKILAIVTMAAFVVTMMPFAAFAADADYQTSYFLTTNSNEEVEVGEAVDLEFEINDSTGTEPATSALTPVTIWATDSQDRVSTAATFYTEGGATVTKAQSVADAAKYTVKFSRDGEYTIHAGVGSNVEEATDNELNYIDGHQTITVLAQEIGDVDSVTIDNADVTGDTAIYNAKNPIKPNSTATQTHTVKATIEGKAAKNEPFTITTSSSNITVTATDMNGNAFDAGTATTDRNGEFKISYSVSKAGNYKIYLTAEDGYKVTLNVKTTDIENYPADITATVTDEAPLNIETAKTAADLVDVAQFAITNNNGGDVTGDLSTIEPAAGASAVGNKADYVKLIDEPEKYKGDAENFTLVWNEDKDAYTLAVSDASKLVEGEYTVRVALYNTGEYADVTFTLAKFDDNAVVDMKVVPKADKVEYTTDSVSYKVVLVDENGVESVVTTDSNAYVMGATASSEYVNPVFKEAGVVTLNVNKDKRDEVVGSTVTLTALSEKYGLIKTAEITLTDTGVVAGLAFDSEAGEADKTNKVNVSVVDENGEIVDVDGTVKYYVVSSSNEAANYEVDVTDESVNEGKGGQLSIYSDKETTLEVVVAVYSTDSKTNSYKLYADTLTYTVGEADVNADTIVAMTIGSSDIIVNNDIVSGDAAPFVDDNWRTMVPVRALSEAFGGSAEWDGDARTVTVVNGDTTIVFTADSDKYTVNGEEKTMDTELTIVDGRTYVPVRFVADELGYQITVLKDAQGLTAGVVFQK